MGQNAQEQYPSFLFVQHIISFLFYTFL